MPDEKLDRARRDLVLANRILAHEGVTDAYGHVSLRHPTRTECFLISRSKSPELVEAADLMEFGLDGAAAAGDQRHPYAERFIHASVYRARPDIAAIVHSHAIDVLPYTITTTPLRPVIHMAAVLGAEIPLWDIRDRFGETNMLVTSAEVGDDLAARLAAASVVLMRGHGFTAAARSLVEAVWMAVYLPINARVQSAAAQMGEVRALSRGEVDRIRDVDPQAPELQRAWRYWATRAGCADLLD